MTNELKAFYYSSDDRPQRDLMAKLKKEGRIRSIGPRLFTSLSKVETQKLLKRNWSEVVANLFPNAHLSYRTALEFKPNEEGYIFITANTDREIRFPGLILKFIKGPASLKTDAKFVAGLKVSSLERSLLENLSTSTKKWANRNVDQEYIEGKLEEILLNKGEDALNELRDNARQIAKELKLEKSFKKLESIIGALLSTKEDKSLRSEQGKARAQGSPFDIGCIGRLEILLGELRTSSFKHIQEVSKNNDHFINKAFFESYFSNYIEGTTFEIEEAEGIIFDHEIIENRTKDSHDILGTFKIVSDKKEMLETPRDSLHLEEIIKRRHLKMMNMREELLPGEFKVKANRAGSTRFVAPEYVRGTLAKGLELYLTLDDPIAKAIFISFLISEVHPFNDGNGRLSRIMFNSEMIKANLSTVIIPNVYREDYLLSLRAMSRRERATPLIKMFRMAQEFSVVDFSKYQKGLNYITEHNWFLEHSEAKIF